MKTGHVLENKAALDTSQRGELLQGMPLTSSENTEA